MTTSDDNHPRLGDADGFIQAYAEVMDHSLAEDTLPRSTAAAIITPPLDGYCAREAALQRSLDALNTARMLAVGYLTFLLLILIFLIGNAAYLSSSHYSRGSYLHVRLSHHPHR